MNRTRVGTIGVLALVVFGSAATFVRGQAEKPAPAAEALATKQQMIRDRLARLEDRMFRLREKLSAAEPENARRLEAALAQAGARDVKARIDRLVATLRAQGATDTPVADQEQLLADLEAVMGVLLDRNPDDAEREKELQRLAEIKERLERVIDEQLAQRRAAARSVQAKRLARQLGDAAAELEQLKQDQAELAERPEVTEKPAEEQVAEQAKLAERAAALQRAVEQLSRRLGDLQQAGAQNQDANAEAPDSAEPKAPDAPASPLEDAARDVEGAKQDMQQAADQQQAGNVAEAKPEQREAVEKLEQAIHRLKEEQAKLDSPADDKTPTEEQRRIAGETQRLAEQMKPPAGAEGTEGEPSPAPQDPQGQPGDQGQQDGQAQKPQPAAPQKPSPGQENVERAKQHMDDAADKLDTQETEQAIQEQDKALDELERAKRELEQTLKQLRKEEQEEVLAGLEARLREMLDQQTAINTETAPLAALGTDHFTRAETLKCAELAERQRAVSVAADTGVRLLEEDGTTVVFPNLLKQLAADTQTIAERLAGAHVGPLTTAMQADVQAALAELLESLQKIREKMQEEKQSGGGGGGGAGANAPLVPTSAELKLLKSSQQRINRQTSAAQQAAGEASPDGEAGALLKRAAEQQQELLNMAREIQQRAEKEMQP